MKVVVATDGSRAGRAALRVAANMVEGRSRDELIVVTVCPARLPSAAEGNGNGPLANARTVLADAAQAVHRRVPSARFEVIQARSGDQVPEAISRHADRVRADMVVVGSEGRESLNEWVVGGTALRLIYIARRPVTVVRAPRRRARA